MKKILIILFVVSFVACESDYAPKPKGYFRIDFPKKEYQVYTANCPYQFEIPKYATVIPYKGSQQGECWVNVDFPKNNARLHISFFDLKNDLEKHLEDSRKLAYKHIVKAEAINEELVSVTDKKVFGLIYQIDGATASGLQFYLTDSTKHFLRGALYFNVQTNIDSIQPVANFIKADIYNLIKTFNWK